MSNTPFNLSKFLNSGSSKKSAAPQTWARGSSFVSAGAGVNPRVLAGQHRAPQPWTPGSSFVSAGAGVNPQVLAGQHRAPPGMPPHTSLTLVLNQIQQMEEQMAQMKGTILALLGSSSCQPGPREDLGLRPSGPSMS
jgi:hypothetical protein